jgi:hypothetical protein
MSMCANGRFGGQDPHKRAEKPDGWVHVETQPTIGFKFHHVISWDSLRDAWQALVECGQWDALESYITAVGVTGGGAIRGKLRRNESLDEATKATLYEKVSWPGWNIVQGPGNRTDEGGKEIDLFTEGMTAPDKDRHVTLGLLWLEMRNFLARVKHLDPGGLKRRRDAARDVLLPNPVAVRFDRDTSDAASRLSRAFNKMAKFKSASFIPYTHSMWDTVLEGHVNKQAVGVWDQTPEFQKTSVARAVVGNMPPKMRCTKCRGVYGRPDVPPRTIIWCKACGKETQVDFRHGVL